VVYKTKDGQAVKVFLPVSKARTEGNATPPEEEFAMMRALKDNPHIIDVFAFDTTADDIRFMIMEYAEGGSVRDLLREKPIPPEEALQILISTARGLKAMHDLGLVHLDVKPQN